MTNTKFISDDNAFCVVIENLHIQELKILCKKSGNNETGGILIGKYSDSLNIAYIQSIIPAPEDSKAGRTWFLRGITGLKEILSSRWKNKKGYLIGEWHYHPDSSPTPSSQDISQMIKYARNEKYNCKEPILLIVGDISREPIPLSATIVTNKGEQIPLSKSYVEV